MQNSGEASLHTLQHPKHKRQFCINQVWAGKQTDRVWNTWRSPNLQENSYPHIHAKHRQQLKIHHLQNRIKTKTPKTTSKPLITVHSLNTHYQGLIDHLIAGHCNKSNQSQARLRNPLIQIRYTLIFARKFLAKNRKMLSPILLQLIVQNNPAFCSLRVFRVSLMCGLWKHRFKLLAQTQSSRCCLGITRCSADRRCAASGRGKHLAHGRFTGWSLLDRSG